MIQPVVPQNVMYENQTFPVGVPNVPNVPNVAGMPGVAQPVMMNGVDRKSVV